MPSRSANHLTQMIGSIFMKYLVQVSPSFGLTLSQLSPVPNFTRYYFKLYFMCFESSLRFSNLSFLRMYGFILLAIANISKFQQLHVTRCSLFLMLRLFIDLISTEQISL
jgi:hypothetical protein